MATLLPIREVARMLEPLLPNAPLSKENDSEIRRDIILADRQNGMKRELYRAGKNGVVRLIHPTMGTVVRSADIEEGEDYFIDAADVEILQAHFSAGTAWQIGALEFAEMEMRGDESESLDLDVAVGEELKTVTPGKTINWKLFSERIQKRCGVAATTRGFGERSIRRAVNRIGQR